MHMLVWHVSNAGDALNCRTSSIRPDVGLKMAFFSIPSIRAHSYFDGISTFGVITELISSKSR